MWVGPPDGVVVDSGGVVHALAMVEVNVVVRFSCVESFDY